MTHPALGDVPTVHAFIQLNRIWGSQRTHHVQLGGYQFHNEHGYD